MCVCVRVCVCVCVCVSQVSEVKDESQDPALPGADVPTAVAGEQGSHVLLHCRASSQSRTGCHSSP